MCTYVSIFIGSERRPRFPQSNTVLRVLYCCFFVLFFLDAGDSILAVKLVASSSVEMLGTGEGVEPQYVSLESYRQNFLLSSSSSIN